MISDETLSTAVNQGVITAEQARRIRDIEFAHDPDQQDDEKLRFISGFGDIFVAIGIGLFLTAAAYFLFQIGSGIAMWAGVAALSWLLAEYFTGVRRMALPSILLLLIFVVSVMFTVFLLDGRSMSVSDAFNLSPRLVPAGLAAALAAGAHYLRFQVPITIAAGAATLVIAARALLNTHFQSEALLSLVTLGLGLATFALAMRYDISDPDRTTRRTDIAFWLHLLAAPMIVHPLVAGMLGLHQAPDTAQALGILGVFLLLGLVALAIDRRALLVSGLLYAGAAFGALLRATGLSDMLVPTTMLALGAFVLLLSAGWHGLRARVLHLLPQELVRRLPREVKAPHIPARAGGTSNG